jgi:hypothetical protein
LLIKKKQKKNSTVIRKYDEENGVQGAAIQMAQSSNLILNAFAVMANEGHLINAGM